MGVMASQITSVSIVYLSVYSGADHWWPVNSPHKGPVTRKMFPFDDVIMIGSGFHRPQIKVTKLFRRNDIEMYFGMEVDQFYWISLIFVLEGDEKLTLI